MPPKDKPDANPDALLREVDAMAEKAADAIDQLLAQRRQVMESAQARAAEIAVRVDKLNELYKTANGRYYVAPMTALPTAAEPGEGKRSRRPKADLEATAKGIVDFVQEAGEDGASGGEIKAKFPGITSSIKAFVKKYAGVSLRDNGAVKAAMRYLPPEA